MSDGFGLLLPFDVDDPEFARGVECGIVWSKIRDNEDTALGPYVMHATNAEMAIRIAEACGRIATSDELDDVWIEVTFVVDPEDAA